jgi:hypothetical protein
MQTFPQGSRNGFKRSVCIGFALFIFVVVAAGCATPKSEPAPEQGRYLKVQVGQNTVSVPWSNNQTPQASNQVTMQQVVDWTKQGVSSDEIISRIKAANPKYSLTAEDIGYLKREGVSQRVIETMQFYK